MSLQEIIKELNDIRAIKFPSAVDLDDNVMRKPHEHYKDNATFAVYLYKQFQKIGGPDGHEQFVQKFDEAKSHADKTRMLLTDPEARKILDEMAARLLDNSEPAVHEKCSEKCSQARVAGNKSFSRKEYDKALASYNEALRVCPDNDESLSMIIANRSHTFFRMRRWEECVADIEDAVLLGYNATERPNLITRKITALRFLGRDNEARVAYEQGLVWADAQPTKKEADSFREKVLEAFKQEMPSSSEVALTYRDRKRPVGQNPLLESASEFVEMFYAPDRGRGLRVTRDVVKGETLIVCKPLAAVLATAFADSHCDHCMRPFGSKPIYCGTCTRVKYCSVDCRQQAARDYHDVECSYHFSLRLYPNGLHVIRALLTCGFEQSFEESLAAKRIALEQWPSMGFRANYKCFSSLFRKEMDSLEFTYSYPMAAALFALFVLQMKLIKPDQLIEFGAVTMMDSLLIISRNADTIFTSDWSTIVGSAVHCTSALFNHSCDPNVHTYYVGSQVVHQAKRPLVAGEEICVSYGVNFAADPLKERREFLQNSYRFDCYCDRCLLELKECTECPKCGLPFERTIYKTMACRRCDVDEDGEYLTDESFSNSSNSEYYCSIQ